MAASDLTTLARAKAYVQSDTNVTAPDPVLTQLISAVSATFRKKTGRDILRKTYAETIDGHSDRIRRIAGISPWSPSGFQGGEIGYISRGWALNLLHYPIISVASVVIDGATIPQGSKSNQADQVDGWLLVGDYAKERLELLGETYSLTTGIQNILATYDAGYYVPAEAATIPANPGPYTIKAQEFFYSDIGVTYANGTALTKVTGVPVATQYSVDASGNYTFAAADQGLAVILKYAAYPADVDLAVCQWVNWLFLQRSREGQRSKSISSEVTLSYQVDAVPPFAQSVIDDWTRTEV